MSSQEQALPLNQESPYRDPREIWIAERDANVMAAARLLILPLIEENPFARLSLGSVLKQISEETDIARTLVHGALRNARDRNAPIDEHGTVLNIACDKGNFYVYATRPFEEIKSLSELQKKAD